METFIPEGNVNILTSLLFLRKRTPQEIQARDLGKPEDEKVFFAVAERVGYDRRGLPLYRRAPDGNVVFREQREIERVRIGGRHVERELVRTVPEIDDDLLLIADAWRKYRATGRVEVRK